jgi:hypothetical protein
MWQSMVLACLVWVMGSLTRHTGMWLTDKTTKLPFGGVLIGTGALLEFLAIMTLLTIHG